MEEGGDELEKAENNVSRPPETDTVNSQNDKETKAQTILKDISADVKNDDDIKPKENETKEMKNPEERLCGWLHHRARGIGNLKMNKLRWFQFGDENCKLYIYREPQDLVPLGEINIATASFFFDAGTRDKQGLFQIKSDGKEVLLDAGNRHNMMYWLQALQNKRREFNLSRSNISHDRVGQWSNKRVSNVGGLLSKGTSAADTMSNPTVVSSSDLPEIRVPDSDTYSSTSSLNSLPPSSSKPSLWPLNNLKTELQQKWSSIKFSTKSAQRKKKTKSAECPGKSSRDNQQQEFSDSIFYCDVKVRSDSELLSNSTTSINSNESLEQTQCLLDMSPDETAENEGGQTESQFSSTESPEKDLEQTQSAKTNRNVPRNTGSWAVIDKKDFISEEDDQEKTDVKTDSNNDQNETWKPFTTNSKNQNQGPSDLEPSKTGKFMSGLKRIRLGKRQVSEPGPPPRTTSQVTNSNIPKHQSHTGDTLRDRTSSNKDVHDLEEELQANREIISLLQRNLDELTKELQSRKEAGGATDEERTTMLVERDKEIVRLQHQLEKTNQEYGLTAEKLRSTEAELKSSQEQASMFTDMLKAKDEILVSLSNQLQDVELEKQDTMARKNSFDQPDVIQSLSSRESTASLSADKADLRELERYKDICQGYELQHKFLTKEILELNDLRKDDLAREKNLTINFAKMQAKYCQIKSKYYVLLKQQKEQGPVREGEQGQEIVKQLLTDALETDEDDIEMHLTGSAEEYDKYGFSRKHYIEEAEEEEEYDPLTSKAAVLEKQSEELNTKVKEADQVASLRVKWENHLVGRGGKLQKGQELKSLIRQGVPHECREEVWKGCVNIHIGDLREQMGPNFYHDLLQRKDVAQGSDPSIKQIELDLLRTLPNNKHYESIESEGIIKLRKVLLAFSEFNRVIGYCQGLNRLAAIALLFLNEEDAFWCLVAIVDYILPPEYFSTTLMAAQADQRVLKDLIQNKLPAVHQKLEANQVDLSLFTFNWFLTVFVDNVPTEMFLRIWDTFLYEGSKVLFRFAIAFLKKAENEILQQNDGLHLNRYLRTIGEKMTNVKQISWYAFNWINPFPMRSLANRRQYHLQVIKEELAELDKIRHGMRVERQKSQQQEAYSDDELDS